MTTLWGRGRMPVAVCDSCGAEFFTLEGGEELGALRQRMIAAGWRRSVSGDWYCGDTCGGKNNTCGALQ